MKQTKTITHEQSTLVRFFQTPITPFLLNIVHYATFTTLALLSLIALVLGFIGFMGMEWYSGILATFVFAILYVFIRISIEYTRVLFDIERNTR